ncbi:MAG: hypothetical protein OXQ29_08580 [Rhodospirillaceae bacterium]|nr:hypothetical protein [Rhodospirillaceae bacterium]
MMVTQTRHIFEVDDLVAVRLQCQACGSEAIHTVERTDVPYDCPFFGGAWEVAQGTPRGDLWQVIRALQGLRSQTEPSVTIRFELDADPSTMKSR